MLKGLEMRLELGSPSGSLLHKVEGLCGSAGRAGIGWAVEYYL